MGEESTAGRPGWNHRVVGAVHEIEIGDADVDAIGETLRRERDECDAGHVLIDLTALDALPSMVIDLIGDIVGPEADRWSVMVPSSTDRDTADRLESSMVGQVLYDAD